MDVYVYIRSQLARVRDSYSATPAQRKRLYLWLKVNDSWKQTSIRKKLGKYNYEWLEGLVRYGDEHGWMPDAVRQAAKEVLR